MNGENGILFEKQTIKSLVEAMEKFEKMKFKREEIAKTVENFKAERFDQEVRDYVKEKVG